MIVVSALVYVRMYIYCDSGICFVPVCIYIVIPYTLSPLSKDLNNTTKDAILLLGAQFCKEEVPWIYSLVESIVLLLPGTQEDLLHTVLPTVAQQLQRNTLSVWQVSICFINRNC